MLKEEGKWDPAPRPFLTPGNKHTVMVSLLSTFTIQNHLHFITVFYHRYFITATKTKLRKPATTSAMVPQGFQTYIMEHICKNMSGITMVSCSFYIHLEYIVATVCNVLSSDPRWSVHHSLLVLSSLLFLSTLLRLPFSFSPHWAMVLLCQFSSQTIYNLF